MVFNDWGIVCNCERSEAIQYISSLYVIGKMSEGQMGESCKDFTPPAPLNNRGESVSRTVPTN